MQHKSVSILALRGWLISAERQGMDPGALCRQAGISAAQLEDERIDAASYLRLMQRVAVLPLDVMPVDGIGGFLTGFPELAGVVCNAPTMRRALRDYVRFRGLIGNLDWMLVADTTDEMAFDFLIEGEQPTSMSAFGHFAIVVALACFYDPEVHVRVVTLTGTPFEKPRALRELIRSTPSFEQAGNRLVLASSQLDRPFERYNNVLARIALDRASTVSSRLEASESFTSVTERLLLAWLHERADDCSVADFQERLCEHFAISRWTLQRRLGSESTSFQSLLMRARMSGARALLARTQLSVGDIADWARYASTGAFTRAFTRESGLPPMQYRALKKRM